MFGQRFDHLFPSPELKFDSSAPTVSRPPPPKRQNLHINPTTLAPPSINPAKIKREADNYRNMMSHNHNVFLTSIQSLERIRRSLTPRFSAVSPVAVEPLQKKSASKKNQPQSSPQENKVDLYYKICLFKTEHDETPMTFIKGKVDILTEQDGQQGLLIIRKLNNYSDNSFGALSCRLIATKKFVKKNEVELMPHDYEVVMAGFIEKCVEPRSSSQDIRI